MILRILLVWILASGLLLWKCCAEDARVAVLASGGLELRVSLPDAEAGYYRGTRFDWSGIVMDARWKGIPLFGEFQDPRDPCKPDHVGGTAEEFDPDGPESFGPVGEGFLKIGVGILRRGSEAPYDRDGEYEILESGRWSWKQDELGITFQQDCGPVRGYACVWTKRVEFGEEPGVFHLRYRLLNSGDRPLTTEHYGHNFFRIGGRDVDSSLTVRFPPEFPLERLGGSESLLRVFRNTLGFRRPLTDGEYVQFGVRLEEKPISVSIWNEEVQLGVEITSSGPTHLFVLYATRRTLCPESYVRKTLAPGEVVEWSTTYRVLERPPNRSTL